MRRRRGRVRADGEVAAERRGPRRQGPLRPLVPLPGTGPHYVASAGNTTTGVSFAPPSDEKKQAALDRQSSPFLGVKKLNRKEMKTPVWEMHVKHADGTTAYA